METRNNINVLPNDTQPAINPSIPPSKLPTKSFLILLSLGIVLGVILTIFISLAIGYFSKNQQNISNPTVQSTTTPITQNTTTSTPEVEKIYGQFGTISWLNEPQKISPLNIFDLKLEEKLFKESMGTNFDFSEAEYYQIGTFSNNAQLINVYFTPNEPGGPILTRFIKHQDKFYLLTEMIVNRDLEDFKQFLLDNVSFSDIKIDELIPPSTITLSNNNILHLSDDPQGSTTEISIFTKPNNLKKVIDSKYGPIYTYIIGTELSLNEVVGKIIYLKLKDGTFVIYKYESIEKSDDQVPKITWNSGDVNTESYDNSLFTGCSTENNGNVRVILNNSTLLNDKIEVGKTKNGDSVYQIKNKNNNFVTALYNSYKQARVGNDNEKIISLNEFVEQDNHFLWQDLSGDWQVFLNNDYGSLAECGKPVIYLYPQKETQIKVQVGAQITVSEPTYPEGGWLVTAKPNGELVYQNQSYPYLFWEGLGNGIYPDYRNRGTVVSQKDLISTLYQQLSQLGLNQKESADFMEFWQPKLPKTPYIRLTWLNTNDMNRLAPLSVYPKPDTSIRIFLEFQGLDKPTKLILQTLTAPKRQGFTLVEWGGLLLKGKE